MFALRVGGTVTDLESTIRAIVRDELAKQKPANDIEHVSIAEYARRWSLSTRTVRDAIHDGRLDATKIGRVYRIALNAKIAERVRDVTEHARLVLLGGSVGRR